MTHPCRSEIPIRKGLTGPHASPRRRSLRPLGAMLAVVWACSGADAGPVVRPVAWSPHGGQDGCHMNMGPTGARVWIRGDQFQVMSVEAGSPGDGVLQPGDIVTGAGGATFSPAADSRMTLGNAILRAEAAGGALSLTLQRDGRKRRATVRLPVTGPFAATWPYGCAKSQRILDDACVYLREAQLPDGTIVTDGATGTFLSGLLFLASGEARFMDPARRAAYATAAMDLEKFDYHNWALGYGGLLLAEYYLSTGDTNVLARVKAVADTLARGQMRCGSWGHNGPSAGYGALNQVGLACALTLVLAQECGVDVDRAALQRALSFYGRYAELGAVPYGDHTPGVRLPDDNGKNSVAAVLFSLVAGREGTAAVFAQSVATSYWQREEGHTGGFFSLVWGAPACDLTGPEEFQTFMDYQAWYYALSRTWRGALTMLPYHEALTRFDDSTYADAGGESTTGGMALTFALPHHKLRILGAPRSVFGAPLSGPLLKARERYQARQWAAFDAEVDRVRTTSASGVARDGDGPANAAEAAQDLRWLAQLEAAAALQRESTRLTVREIENNLAEGDAYRASEQYLALKRLLGEKAEILLALDQRFADATVQWHMRAGNSYYKAWKDLRGVAIMTWLPYGAMAKSHVGEVPRLRPSLWETLLPVSEKAPRPWSTKDDGVSGEFPFVLETTDYTTLRLQLRSPRNAHTQVRLNGTPVAEAVRGRRSDYAGIVLDERTRSLLRVGTNLLTVSSTSVGSGGNALDVGLDAVRRERPPPATPVRRKTAATAPASPAMLRATLEKARLTFQSQPVQRKPSAAVPEPLSVRDSEERFQAALDAACDALSVEALDAALRSPVAYWRYLAGQSLSRRGDAGRRVAVAGLADADWRVRSACCDALSFGFEATRKSGSQAVDAAVIGRLTERVADGNAWVRCRAAGALAAAGKPDASAAAALAKAAIDPDDWVRAAVVGALGKMTDDPRVLVKAATDALLVPETSFAVVGRSLPLLEPHGTNDPAVVSALVFAIDHPGEGAGSAQLVKAMELLVERDPGGTNAVPSLARVAAGGYAYNRLQGDPRKRAVELLAGMGRRAASAAPVLKTLVTGSNEKEKALRAAAQAALGQIGAE